MFLCRDCTPSVAFHYMQCPAVHRHWSVVHVAVTAVTECFCVATALLVHFITCSVLQFTGIVDGMLATLVLCSNRIVSVSRLHSQCNMCSVLQFTCIVDGMQATLARCNN